MESFLVESGAILDVESGAAVAVESGPVLAASELLLQAAIATLIDKTKRSFFICLLCFCEIMVSHLYIKREKVTRPAEIFLKVSCLGYYSLFSVLNID